jgi:hypothetical protein
MSTYTFSAFRIGALRYPMKQSKLYDIFSATKPVRREFIAKNTHSNTSTIIAGIGLYALAGYSHSKETV